MIGLRARSARPSRFPCGLNAEASPSTRRRVKAVFAAQPPKSRNSQIRDLRYGGTRPPDPAARHWKLCLTLENYDWKLRVILETGVSGNSGGAAQARFECDS